jgi:hypothetical protein
LSLVAFDQWDVSFPQICFGLKTHVSSATGTSQFELAYGFPATLPLNMDVMEDATAAVGRIRADFAFDSSESFGCLCLPCGGIGGAFGSLVGSAGHDCTCGG